MIQSKYNKPFGLNIIFRLSKSNQNKLGYGYIVGQIYFNGVYAKKNVNTGLMCKKEFWSRGKAFGFKECDVINEALMHIRNKVYCVYHSLHYDVSRLMNADDFLSYYTTGQDIFSIDYMFAHYLDYKKKKVQESTFNKDKSTLETAKVVLKKHSNIKNLGDISTHSLQVMGDNAIHDGGYATRTVKDIIAHLKSSFKYLVREKRLPYSVDFGKIKLKEVKKKNKVKLEQDTIEILLNNCSSQPKTKEEKSINWFTFMCFTGMHYNELCNSFVFEDAYKSEMDVPYFQFKRIKTGEYCFVPIIKGADTLMYYFNGKHKKDFRSVSSLNYYLKKSLKKIGIEEHITSSIGRITLGSHMIQLSAESAQRSLGHSKKSITEEYYEVIPQTTLQAIWKQYNIKELFSSQPTAPL